MQTDILGKIRIQIRHSLVLIFCCIGVVSASAQLILVKGSPFEATRTRIINRPGENFSVSGRVARNSDSSTYEELPNIKTGEITLIHILDVPGQRDIFLDVKHRFYSIQLMSLSSIGNLPSSEAQQKYIEFLRTWKGSHTSDNGVETEKTSLGFRTQDGFLEFGTRTVFDHIPPSWSLKEKVWEDWSIPALSITVEKTGFDNENRPSSATKLSNIRTTEPDPHLFEIPQDYAPSPVRSSR